MTDLQKAERRAAWKQHLISRMCMDWAEDDTRIKEICKVHGIDVEGTGDDFKTAIECVEELAALIPKP